MRIMITSLDQYDGSVGVGGVVGSFCGIWLGGLLREAYLETPPGQVGIAPQDVVIAMHNPMPVQNRQEDAAVP